MANALHRLYENLTRKKTYDTESMHNSQLRRCLTVFDLTILGRMEVYFEQHIQSMIFFQVLDRH